jgi:hypothetical protein
MSVHPMHRGARRALAATGILMCVLVFMLPFGVWILLSLRRARVEVSDGLIEEKNALRCKRRLVAEEVKRLGVYHAEAAHGGVTGAVVRAKLGGDVGVNLCWQDRRGKTRWICLSLYERPEDVLDAAQDMTGVELEELSMGFFGVRWPVSA